MTTERMILWSILLSGISLGMSIYRIIQIICEK